MSFTLSIGFLNNSYFSLQRQRIRYCSSFFSFPSRSVGALSSLSIWNLHIASVYINSLFVSWVPHPSGRFIVDTYISKSLNFRPSRQRRGESSSYDSSGGSQPQRVPVRMPSLLSSPSRYDVAESDMSPVSVFLYLIWAEFVPMRVNLLQFESKAVSLEAGPASVGRNRIE